MDFFNFLFHVGVQPIKNARTVSGGQQRDSVLHIHVTISPLKLTSYPGCHMTLIRPPVLYSSSLMVIHFKYSSVYLIHAKLPNYPNAFF